MAIDIFPPFGSPVNGPNPQVFVPDPAELARVLEGVRPDPSLPLRPRPPREVLLERKRWALRFWRDRNQRMIEDELLYKRFVQVEPMVGGEEVGASETFVGNDPYVLVEKVSNMIASQEPTVQHITADPGLRDISQKIRDFLAWWRDEAADRWESALNNNLSRDEIHFLALRGWLCGRVMLDPNDTEWPYRYDLIDPINVYPKVGNKGLRWVFHIYRESKANLLNDFGFDQATLDRIEEALGNLQTEADIEVASFYDDLWHVLFVNDVEVWSAPHNYGFVPWIIAIANGPPIRKTNPVSGGTYRFGFGSVNSPDYTRWWGVSIFEPIKDVYEKTNKLASAILTEIAKVPNPPVVVYTNQAGEAEGKTIDTSIGATNYLLYNQEKFDVIQYGFRPEQLMPLLQLLNDQRARGSLPDVMYGQGAQYLSGFAVNLLQGGARDILLPLVKSHEGYLARLYRAVLRMTAEVFPFPVSMVATNPENGERDQFTSLDPEDIRRVGYRVRVAYRNIGPQDRQMQAAMAAMLVDKKIISLDTARGEEFLDLKNPTIENQKVLADMAWLDPEVVKAAIPLALLSTNPMLYWVYMHAQAQKLQEQIQQMAMMSQAAPKPPGQPSQPKGKKLPNHILPDEMQAGGNTPPPPPNAPPQTGPV